jgi:hypothetical protein
MEDTLLTFVTVFEIKNNVMLGNNKLLKEGLY